MCITTLVKLLQRVTLCCVEYCNKVCVLLNTFVLSLFISNLVLSKKQRLKGFMLVFNNATEGILGEIGEKLGSG